MAVVYGFAKYMRDALPNATYLGFTGTPIEAGKKLVNQLDEDLTAIQSGASTANRKAKAKWTQLEALIGSENRVKNIAKDIIWHWNERDVITGGKGMIVSMSRRIAADLYEEIIKIKPEWHSADLDKGVIKIVMTSASSDGSKIAKHHTTKQQRKILADRMKDTEDELKLVIVRDMWLTGFDVPSILCILTNQCKGITLCRQLQELTEFTKINLVVVDYLGIASDLKKPLLFIQMQVAKATQLYYRNKQLI